jgi:predicted double-glycine peptidase
MVLAAFGTNVEEGEVEAHAHLEEEGTLINELERLARFFHIKAEIQDATLEDLNRILMEGKLPIAYIDRAVFDMRPRQRAKHSIRNAIIHTVIPIRVTSRSVTFHDPRLPQITRKTIRLFERAYMGLGGRCVVCSKPEQR